RTAMFVIQDLIALVGRVLLVAVFFVGAIEGQIFNFRSFIENMKEKSLPYPEALLVGASILVLGGSLLVLLGFKARLGAFLLILFLAAASYLFHDFWNVDKSITLDRYFNVQGHFFKNVSIIGALLLIVANGPGVFSLDSWNQWRASQ